MNDKALPDGVTGDFWISSQAEDFPLSRTATQGNLEASVTDEVYESGDMLDFDDDVPVVIQSRFRLCLSLARSYGMDATLYDVGSTPGQKWVTLITGGRLGEIIPVSCSTPHRFTLTFHSAHGHLEAVYEKGITLAQAAAGDEADVSAPVKGDSAPI